LQHDPSLLRGFLMQQEGDDKDTAGLLRTMIETLLAESESGLQEQMCDVLRMLLDAESLQPSNKERSEFWDVFYQKYFWRVIGVLTEDSCPNTLVLVLDLLCFCVHVHSMWIKYFIMRNKMVDRVAKLMYRKEKVVVLAALRLLRTCLGLKDDFYNTQIINHNAFAPLVDVFLANGERYNMLNSAVLELFEFLKKENLKPLIKYSVEKFWENRLSTIAYSSSFKQLKQMHEQNVNNENVRAEGDKTVMAELKISRMRRRRDGSMDKEEESYFESDDDEAAMAPSDQMMMDPNPHPQPFPSPRVAGSVIFNSASLPPLPSLGGGSPWEPLVDYDDDDDMDVSSSHQHQQQQRAAEEEEDGKERKNGKKNDDGDGRLYTSTPLAASETPTNAGEDAPSAEAGEKPPSNEPPSS